MLMLQSEIQKNVCNGLEKNLEEIWRTCRVGLSMSIIHINLR